MKLTIKILFFVILVIFTACKNDDISSIDEPIILSDTIETYNENIIEDSYILAVENGAKNAFVFNKKGDTIKEWNFDLKLGNDLEILPDGRLLGMFKTEAPFFEFGGYGGIIRILNSEGVTEWEYEYASENHLAHHDVEMLPNGNVLFLVWEKVDAITAQGMGIQTNVDVYPEALLEVNPSTNQIVWEWHSIDHMIQEAVSTLPTFGNVGDNPQLIDFNYLIEDNGDNWHANGIDIDEEKDVIYISVNFYNEVWVIDHNTTTQQASTHSGGNYNKGGDLLYRFGNPTAYRNSLGEQLFHRNHFPNLIKENKPGFGNILVYENGIDDLQSTVYELEIPEPFNLLPNTNNEPNIVWSFTDENLFFSKISGAVRLTNGNTLICEGDYGFWEVTNTNEIAWKFNGQGSTFWRAYGYDINSPEIENQNL